MTTDTFSLGLTYRPRRSGFFWWRTFDRGVLRDDLAHIAALGFDTIRVQLDWEEFQPEEQRIGSTAMRAFEYLLDEAAQQHLAVVPVLFPVTVLDVLHLPRWANEPDVLALLRGARRSLGMTAPLTTGKQVFSGERFRLLQCDDLFSEPRLLAAQRYQLREVAGYFGQHPAIAAWQLGDGLEYAHRPGTEQATHTWALRLTDTLRQMHPRAQTLFMATRAALTQRAGPRPDLLTSHADRLAVNVDAPELLSNPAHMADNIAYMHALVAGLAGRRVIVSGIGMPGVAPHESGWQPIEAYGASYPTFFGATLEQAEFTAVVLDALYRAGAAGAWLACYADRSPVLQAVPPFDRSQRLHAAGIVTSDGQEKPVAEAISAFVRGLPIGRTQPHAQPGALDTDRYWHQPQRAFETLRREFRPTR